MACEKTGFQAYLSCYGEYVVGDAFNVEGTYLFRINFRERELLRENIHYVISDYAHWLDELHTSVERGSLMVCKGSSVRYLGYEGVDPKKVKEIRERIL